MRVTVDLTPGTARRIAGIGATLLLVLGGLVAYASPIPNLSFTAGNPLHATELNANFNNIEGRLTKPVVTKNGKQFSLGATYCGMTNTTNGQITNGYAGAKALCETACSSPSAHMCDGAEVVRSLQAGITMGTTGWVSAGTYAGNGGGRVTDCYGWSSNVSDGTAQGNGWTPTVGTGTPPGAPWALNCDGNYPVLCCD
jgi:hypothetical protein